jgi:hypothetical protein
MQTIGVSHDKESGLIRVLSRVTIAFAAGLALLFLFTALRRLRYPFELDRMESAMMTTVWRIAHGLPIYDRPSLEWVPFLYAPVFFYCSAAVAKITGLGYAALRLVSILATLGSCGVIFTMIYRETRHLAAATAGAGLFIGLYGVTLSWYDIGRVDSLSVFFFLAALYCTRFASPVLAALVWLLAFQTKQSFLPIAILAFLTEWPRPRRVVTGLLSFGVLAYGSVWLLNHHTAGWYSYYVFGTVGELHLSLRYAALYIPIDLIQPLGVALAFIVLALLVAPPDWRSRAAIFYGAMTLVILGGIGFARAHEGSYVNTLIPAYAWLCVLFGLAIVRVLGVLESSASTSIAPAAAQNNLSRAMQATVWIFVLAQLSMHLYRPGEFDPGAGTLATRNHFLDQLRHVSGDVWVVNHSYDSILAGKGMHAEMDALDAVLGRPDPTVANEIRQAYATHRFATVMLDRAPDSYSPEWLFNGPEFSRHFPLVAFAPSAPIPNSGDQPVMMYLSCDTPSPLAHSLEMDSTFVKQGICPVSTTDTTEGVEH